jgi:hypothetical protein
MLSTDSIRILRTRAKEKKKTAPDLADDKPLEDAQQGLEALGIAGDGIALSHDDSPHKAHQWLRIGCGGGFKKNHFEIKGA